MSLRVYQALTRSLPYKALEQAYRDLALGVVNQVLMPNPFRSTRWARG